MKTFCEVRAAGYEVPERFAELRGWSEFAVVARYPPAETRSLDRVRALELVTAVREWAEELIEQAAG